MNDPFSALIIITVAVFSVAFILAGIYWIILTIKEWRDKENE